MTKNIEASVKAKLLVIAKKSERDFNTILLQYFQERFLYRLSISKARNNFVLKGAMLFRIYNMPASRPTVDIDFLGRNTENSEENLIGLLIEVMLQDYPDGVRFDTSTIASEVIKESDDYQGVRIFCEAFLGKAKRRIHIDIGFGDIIVPKPTILEFPVLIDDFSIPKIITYTPESAIAEKFEAIVSLGIFTSRMKDFFDIHYMSQNYKFNSIILQKAIYLTFKNRETKIENSEYIFSKEFKENLDKQKQWKAFLNRINSEINLNFSECVHYIESFIDPIIRNRIGGAKWDSDKQVWIESDHGR